MNIIELMAQGGIRIPKIQREYAQGREDNAKIRKNFATALMNAVWGREARNLSLGYVFGYKDGNGVFYPLDGQQRLTTLFLLVWHCGTDMRGWKLDYEGRRNSQLFLKGLVEHPRNQKTLNSADEIRNSAWFFNDWEDDASVSGMLRMLEEFDECWTESRVACDVMEHANESHLERITFSVHLFDGYDQATFGKNYLRMNARGVPLTPWENLKALVTPHLGYSTISTVNNEITEGLWALRRDLPADERRIVEIDVMLESILRLAMYAYYCSEDDFSEKVEHDDDEDKKWTKGEDISVYMGEFFLDLAKKVAFSPEFRSSCFLPPQNNFLWTGRAIEESKESVQDFGYELSKCDSDPNRSLLMVPAFWNAVSPRLKRTFLNLIWNTTDAKEGKVGDCIRGFRQLSESDALRNGTLLTLAENDEVWNDICFKFWPFENRNPQKGERLKVIAEACPFNKRQFKDEVAKASLDEAEIVRLEMDPLVWKGSLNFLHLDENQPTLESLKCNLETIRSRIQADWKDFFLAILQNLPYQNPDELPEMVVIPYDDERLWAENFFANHKERIHQSLKNVLDGNLSFQKDEAPCWLRHLAGILDWLPKGWKIVYKHGWNYIQRGSNITVDSIRLPWNDTEAKNLQRISGAEHGYLTWEQHRGIFVPDKENPELFYRVDDGGDSSWWESETPTRYQCLEVQYVREE